MSVQLQHGRAAALTVDCEREIRVGRLHVACERVKVDRQRHVFVGRKTGRLGLRQVVDRVNRYVNRGRAGRLGRRTAVAGILHRVRETGRTVVVRRRRESGRVPVAEQLDRAVGRAADVENQLVVGRFQVGSPCPKIDVDMRVLVGLGRAVCGRRCVVDRVDRDVDRDGPDGRGLRRAVARVAHAVGETGRPVVVFHRGEDHRMPVRLQHGIAAVGAVDFEGKIRVGRLHVACQRVKVDRQRHVFVGRNRSRLRLRRIVDGEDRHVDRDRAGCLGRLASVARVGHAIGEAGGRPVVVLRRREACGMAVAQEDDHAVLSVADTERQLGVRRFRILHERPEIDFDRLILGRFERGRIGVRRVVDRGNVDVEELPLRLGRGTRVARVGHVDLERPQAVDVLGRRETHGVSVGQQLDRSQGCRAGNDGEGQIVVGRFCVVEVIVKIALDVAVFVAGPNRAVHQHGFVVHRSDVDLDLCLDPLVVGIGCTDRQGRRAVLVRGEIKLQLGILHLTSRAVQRRGHQRRVGVADDSQRDPVAVEEVDVGEQPEEALVGGRRVLVHADRPDRRTQRRGVVLVNDPGVVAFVARQVHRNHAERIGAEIQRHVGEGKRPGGTVGAGGLIIIECQERPGLGRTLERHEGIGGQPVSDRRRVVRGRQYELRLNRINRFDHDFQRRGDAACVAGPVGGRGGQLVGTVGQGRRRDRGRAAGRVFPNKTVDVDVAVELDQRAVFGVGFDGRRVVGRNIIVVEEAQVAPRHQVESRRHGRRDRVELEGDLVRRRRLIPILVLRNEEESMKAVVGQGSVGDLLEPREVQFKVALRVDFAQKADVIGLGHAVDARAEFHDLVIVPDGSRDGHVLADAVGVAAAGVVDQIGLDVWRFHVGDQIDADRGTGGIPRDHAQVEAVDLAVRVTVELFQVEVLGQIDAERGVIRLGDEIPTARRLHRGRFRLVQLILADLPVAVGVAGQKGLDLIGPGGKALATSGEGVGAEPEVDQHKAVVAAIDVGSGYHRCDRVIGQIADRDAVRIERSTGSSHSEAENG